MAALVWLFSTVSFHMSSPQQLFPQWRVKLWLIASLQPWQGNKVRCKITTKQWQKQCRIKLWYIASLLSHGKATVRVAMTILISCRSMFLRVTWYFYFGVTMFKFAAKIQLSVVSCSTSVFFLSCFKLWQEINDQDIRPGNFICLQPNSLARASLKMRKHDTSPLVPFVFTADCKIAFARRQCQMYSYIRLEILRACYYYC